MGAALGWRRKVYFPVARDIDAATKPDIIVALDMLDKLLKRLKAAGPPDQAAVEADIHQAGGLRALLVEHVETIAQVSEERLSPVEPRRGGKAVIVDIRGIGNDTVGTP